MLASYVPLHTGRFDTLDPPPQPILALVHMKTVYFHDPISIPVYHAHFQNYSIINLLPSGPKVYV